MRPATIAAIFAVFCTVVAEGQSKNPFGIPSADTPQPGSADQGGARLARAGLARPGPIGSDRAPRHGGDERSAGR